MLLVPFRLLPSLQPILKGVSMLSCALLFLSACSFIFGGVLLGVGMFIFIINPLIKLIKFGGWWGGCRLNPYLWGWCLWLPNTRWQCSRFHSLLRWGVQRLATRESRQRLVFKVNLWERPSPPPLDWCLSLMVLSLCSSYMPPAMGGPGGLADYRIFVTWVRVVILYPVDVPPLWKSRTVT